MSIVQSAREVHSKNSQSMNKQRANGHLFPDLIGSRMFHVMFHVKHPQYDFLCASSASNIPSVCWRSFVLWKIAIQSRIGQRRPHRPLPPPTGPRPPQGGKYITRAVSYKTQTMFHVKHYLFAFVSFCIRLSMSAAVLCHRIL